MAAHRAVQEGWASHAGAAAGSRILWLIHGLCCPGTQQPAGAGHPGKRGPGVQPSGAGQDRAGLPWHPMPSPKSECTEHFIKKVTERKGQVAALGCTVAPLQRVSAPRLYWVSAHGPVLKRREGLCLQTRKLRLRWALVHSGPDLCQAQADPQGVVLQWGDGMGGCLWVVIAGVERACRLVRNTVLSGPCKLSPMEAGVGL